MMKVTWRAAETDLAKLKAAYRDSMFKSKFDIEDADGVLLSVEVKKDWWVSRRWWSSASAFVVTYTIGTGHYSAYYPVAAKETQTKKITSALT